MVWMEPWLRMCMMLLMKAAGSLLEWGNTSSLMVSITWGGGLLRVRWVIGVKMGGGLCGGG